MIAVAGVTTALTSWLAIGAARHTIESWLRQGPVVVRLTGILVVALGGFVAYACAPGGRDPE